MRYRYFFAVCFAIFSCNLTACSLTQQSPLERYPQRAEKYIDHPAIIIDAERQRGLSKDYLAHYFSPWQTSKRFLSNSEILQQEQGVLARFMQNPGFAENQQAISRMQIAQIAANMDLNSFPNHLKQAITLHTADVRLLPSMAPSFTALQPAWEYYPFDNLQTSLLPANTPVLVLQTTYDQAWVLILAHNLLGWLPAHEVASVDQNFIHRWQTKNWLVPLRDGAPVMVSKRYYQFSARLGMLLPLLRRESEHYKIQVAIADRAQHAVIVTATLEKAQAALFPLAADADNFIKIINAQLGQPYGWGGLYGYRDCSSTLADIFTPFGIWLPRNSQQQARMGQVFDLEGLTPQQKQGILLSRGVPLLTLVRLPGHIMLYIGQHEAQAYILQNAWGLRSKNWLSQKEGRQMIGQVFIAPIDAEQGPFNNMSLLKRVKSLSVLAY